MKTKSFIPSKKYPGFLIDADNTIFDFNLAEREALQETLLQMKYKNISLHILKIFRQINKKLWLEIENKTLHLNDLKIERFRLLFEKIAFKGDPEEFSSIYLDRLSKKYYTLPHAIEVLDFLSCRAVLSLITNGISYVQRGRIGRAAIEIFFNDIIISEEIGYTKPDTQFFYFAAKSLNLPPFNILCVGDSPSADIWGAHLAGMDTCWFTYHDTIYPDSLPQPDYIINDLRELKAFPPAAS